MRYIHCPSGMKIPYIGFGTYTLTKDDIEAVIPLAYRTGYRLFDCAQYYGNESYIGSTIKEYNLPRNHLFISTKVHPDIRTYEEAKQAIEQSLKDLQVDYLDLLLLHSPTPLDKLDQDHTPYYPSNHEVYKAMEEAYKVLYDNGQKERAVYTPDFEVLSSSIRKETSHGDLFLLKGSRSMAMERLFDTFKEVG